MRLPNRIVFGAMSLDESRLAFFVQEGRRHRDCPAGVQHVNNRFAIVWSYLYGGMRPAGSGPANQQWQLKSLALHLLCNVHHFVERWGDEAAEADEVSVLRSGSL